MSDDNDEDPPLPEGRRKDGKPYREGNTREDGSYCTGKNRPDKSKQFAKGDGRQRGRRPKGVPNNDTVFLEEYNRKITITEDGQKRRVTKGQASDIRLLNNAYNKGQNRAIELVEERRRRILDKQEAEKRDRSSPADTALIDEYFRLRNEQLTDYGTVLGDPLPSLVDHPEGELPNEEDVDAD